MVATFSYYILFLENSYMLISIGINICNNYLTMIEQVDPKTGPKKNVKTIFCQIIYSICGPRPLQAIFYHIFLAYSESYKGPYFGYFCGVYSPYLTNRCVYLSFTISAEDFASCSLNVLTYKGQ